jgi:glycosyltransferase involved in cell wall biosynthesis
MATQNQFYLHKWGDIPEILGATGYLVEPSSPKQISEKLIFKHQVEVSELGIKARQRCVERYSIQAMASILLT